MADPGSGPASEALALMRRGEVTGALSLLEQAAADVGLDLEGETLRFLLLRQTGAEVRALEVAERLLERELEPLGRSTWLLRKGLVLLALDRRSDAARALQEVLKLRASEDHERQARKALLDAARR